MNFMLGANYWGYDWGTEMWLHYDGNKIRQEFKQLYEYGIRYLRVFPNWRDFQPVEKTYGYKARSGEYVNANTKKPISITDDGVDPDRIEDFRDLCHAAEETGLKLVVSIVTGWMSGRLFMPPALHNKDLITDPEALMWTRKFIHRFVRELKNEKSIVMWDLGNECNCMGVANTAYDAYNWTSTVADAIRSEDRTRPISSGMHSLESNSKTYSDPWLIEYQGELCDVLTTHPYATSAIGADKVPFNRLGPTLLPTAQTLYYQGVSGKPAYIQESGTFAQSIGCPDMSAQSINIQILSSLVNGLGGFQWWCAWDQMHLDFSPYTWCLMERQLGLFDKNKNPKPTALKMQKLSNAIESMPDPFPKRTVDGICVLSLGQNRLFMSMSSVVLGKQAGIDLDVNYTLQGEIPDSKLYIMPSVADYFVTHKPTWDKLLEKVSDGATLCLTYNGGHLVDLEETFGIKSWGVVKDVKHKTVIDGQEINYTGCELIVEPAGAEVILRNEDGNPVLLKNKYGKGTIYFVSFDLEGNAFTPKDSFNKDPYYLIYREVAKEIIQAKPVVVKDRNLGITINPENDNSMLVSVLNYSDHDIVPEIELKDEFKITDVLYGNMDAIAACDGVIFRITKK